MRIALLADARSPHSWRWKRALERAGENVTLYSLERAGEHKGEYERLGTAGGRVKYWRAAGPLCRRFRRSPPDLIFAHYIPNYGLLGARVAGRTPLVLGVWGSDLLITPRKSPLHDHVTSSIVRRADLIVADAELCKRVLTGRYGVDSQRVLVMPFGVERDVLLHQKRAKLPHTVVSVRLHEEVYDLVTVLRAAKLLQKRGVELNLTFGSSGSQTEQLKAEAARLGVKAVFTGWQNRQDYLKTLAQSGLFVSAALSDATPVSLLEGMALGGFPVMSDLMVYREWLVQGTGGLFFEPSDPASCADALQRALADNGMRRLAAKVNRQTVERRANWELNADRAAQQFRLLALGDMEERVSLPVNRRFVPWSRERA